MKNILLILNILLSGFAINQTLSDSINNLEIVNAKADVEYLSFVPDIYIPTNLEFIMNPQFVSPTEHILSDRYGCSVSFFENANTNNIQDPIFEVTVEYPSFGVLYLNLSILEQMYQRGIIHEQVKLYCKWTDMIVNENFQNGINKSDGN